MPIRRPAGRNSASKKNRDEALYRGTLRTGIAERTFVLEDVAIAGRAIIGAPNRLVDWYRAREDQTDADRYHMARTLAQTAIYGIRA